LQGVDQSGAAARPGAEPGEMLSGGLHSQARIGAVEQAGAAHRCAAAADAADARRSSASGSPSALRRYAAAASTAATQARVIASSQSEKASVPVPRPWSTATGHAA